MFMQNVLVGVLISFPHSYPQLSGGVVRAEEACALNEQMKSKPSPPKDFHSWSRITIASDVATSFSDQQ